MQCRVGGGECQAQEVPMVLQQEELGTQVCLGSGGGIGEGQGPAHAEPLSLGKDCGHSKCKRKPVRSFLKEKRPEWHPWSWKKVRGFRAF